MARPKRNGPKVGKSDKAKDEHPVRGLFRTFSGGQADLGQLPGPPPLRSVGFVSIFSKVSNYITDLGPLQRWPPPLVPLAPRSAPEQHPNREVLETKLVHLTKHAKFQKIACKRRF